ncbi:MAG: glycoside hydrolase family 2 [Bacteroidales bacterium]|nr:glycoside hydrolase family 2 [Bacteroidales bacterium]
MKNQLLFLLALAISPVLFAQTAALKDIKKVNSYSPKPVTSPGLNPIISLNGNWKFNPEAGAEMESVKPVNGSGWRTISVPGDWTNQGFKVKPGMPGLYFRAFTIPAEWKDQQIKLRADGLQSWAKIWINNKYAGAHLGGFTANEIDITALVKPGTNKIFIAVQNESIADSLASTTQYAAFQIGGIFRKIYLMALPKVNISELLVESGFNENRNTGHLKLKYRINNQSASEKQNIQVRYVLHDSFGKEVAAGIPANTIASLQPGKESEIIAESVIPDIQPWDCEHPRLYTLSLQLYIDSKLIETVEKKTGFRTISVVGNQVFVNGMPIKLRGSNRHETYPTTGRTITSEICLTDAILFRNANVNYIRTSHYPPSEEFLDACDSLGMYVEVESPFCWVGHEANAKWAKDDPKSLSFVDYIMQATRENIKFNFNHPSILIWSLANESLWSDIWKQAHALADELDPTRPKTFHDQAFGGYNNAGSTEMPIANYHYPGDAEPFDRRNNARPLLFGEYCHINTYNRREILTDPGVRDNWGEGFSRMWERCYLSKAVLGAAIWAGIDDIFYLPDSTAVGYGEWGIIDGWRRTKPEYFHVKKSYSPIKLIPTETDWPDANGIIRLNIENRHDFTNLSELQMSWKAGDRTGVTTLSLAPRTEGILEIPTGKLTGSEEFLEVWFNSPRDFEIDHYKIPFKKPALPLAKNKSIASGKAVLKETLDSHIVTIGGLVLTFDKKLGQLVFAVRGQDTIINGAPSFMMLAQATEECRPQHNLFIKPLNNLQEWDCQKFSLNVINDTVVFTQGMTKVRASVDGTLQFSYEYTVTQDINPRQYGMVLHLNKSCNTLEWNRKGIWTAYPEGHIGRESGRVCDSVPTNKRNIWTKPANDWKDDIRPLGNSDFCSTKAGILNASLTSPKGYGIYITSDGRHSVRAFREENSTGFLIADFNSGGGDLFFAGHHQSEDRPLKTGEKVKGSFSISIY